jgi:uncharacterized protein with HEPN domain
VYSERVRQCLADIIENADSITGYVGSMTREEYQNDPKTVDAVERCFMRLTEAVIRIGPETMNRIAPSIPVGAIRGLGNLLRHHYDEIDAGVILGTARVSLPVLRAACIAALETR